MFVSALILDELLPLCICVLTLAEQPSLGVYELRELKRAGGLIRREVAPPWSGWRGVGRSSLANTEEKSSLSTCTHARQKKYSEVMQGLQCETLLIET